MELHGILCSLRLARETSSALSVGLQKRGSATGELLKLGDAPLLSFPPPSCASGAMATPTTRRRRSSSLLQYVATAHDQRDHHLSHLERLEPAPPPTHPSALTSASSSSSNARPRLPRRPTDPIIQSSKAAAAPVPVQEYGHPALRFIARPHDTFLVLAAVFSLWAAWRTFLPREYRSSNPFSAFLVVQHQVDWRGEQRFRKGWKDALFLVYWVVVFSFLRETVMRGPARALGKRWGIRLGCRKMERFMEQVREGMYRVQEG